MKRRLRPGLRQTAARGQSIALCVGRGKGESEGNKSDLRPFYGRARMAVVATGLVCTYSIAYERGERILAMADC